MAKVAEMLPQSSQLQQGLIADSTAETTTQSKAQPSERIERIEKIFEALVVHYGASRMAAHWDGIDMKKLKNYWAYKLTNASSDVVRHVLQNLPKIPPNVDEFLEIGRRCPKPTWQCLDALPVTPKDEALKRLDAIKQRFPAFNRANYPKPDPIIHETTEVSL